MLYFLLLNYNAMKISSNSIATTAQQSPDKREIVVITL